LSSDIIRSACCTGVNSGQLAQQPVELRIGDRRRVEDVVPVLVLGQLVAELGVPGAGLRCRIRARGGHLFGRDRLLHCFLRHPLTSVAVRLTAPYP
jgi:hypothetical protein